MHLGKVREAIVNYIVSTTKNVLLAQLQTMNASHHFVKREVLCRLLALTAIFFRVIDTLANFLIAICKGGGRLLRAMGVHAIHLETVSNQSIRASFKAAKYSAIKEPFRIFRLLRSPELYLSGTESLGPPDPSDKNWGLNDYFGHVYVINLDDTAKSGDRFARNLQRITRDLHNVGCQTFERFRATDGATELEESVWKRVDDNSLNLEPGVELDRQHKAQAGCFMSHYRVIKDAQEKHQHAIQMLRMAKNDNERTAAEVAIKEYDSILILEDDNGFGWVNKPPIGPATVNMQGSGNAFKQIMRELPKDWDMLYLLSIECGPKGTGWMKAKSPSFSKHLNRLQYGLLTNAVAINSRAYPIILKALSKIDDPLQKFRPVDHEYARLHKKLNVFTPKHPLAYQAPGESSIIEASRAEPWNGVWDRGL